jgi:transposase-like protein
MAEHLGYEKYDPVGRGSGNSRNGTRSKTVIILSRESDHAFDQGFSDEDSVVDAVLSMAR